MFIFICCLPRLAVDDSDSDADNVEKKLLRDADYNSDNLDTSLTLTKAELLFSSFQDVRSATKSCKRLSLFP